MKIISDSLFFIYTSLTSEGVFLVCCAIIFLAFIVNLILWATVKNYKKSKRRWFYFTVPTVISLQVSMSLFASESGAYIALIVFFAIPLIGVSLSLKERGAVIKKEQIDLAKYFDAKAREVKPIKELNELDNGYDIDREDKEAYKPLSPSNVQQLLNDERQKEYGLDFSHVKNVLSRLDYFSLSPADKRQVKDLEVTLAQAERGEFTLSLKEKLNDGLGLLLKIMSKYGV